MPSTLLSLPVEIRLKIYELTLQTSNIHSFRPQRKIGWNRPHADLSNPAQLFESDAHPVLRRLFHDKLTKGDHAAILISLLRTTRALIVNHEDFSALQKVAQATTLVSGAVGMSSQARIFAQLMKDNLRTIDFSDKLDDIVCHTSDLTKLIRGLPGLKTICLASRHIQRYSGTVQEHIEYAKERATRELERQPMSSTPVTSFGHTAQEPDPADELRRLSLRSPITDGTRMLVSPMPWSRSGSNTPQTSSCSSTPQWIVVDLSLLVWQHFLYTGAPYRDHWRCVKMQALLDLAEKHKFDVVLSFRNVEFDPESLATRRMHAQRSSVQALAYTSSWSRSKWNTSGTFRGEMSTADWLLKLRPKSEGPEYGVRQRRHFDVPVSQEESGMTRCRHRRRRSSICVECVGAAERVEKH